MFAESKIKEHIWMAHLQNRDKNVSKKRRRSNGIPVVVLKRINPEKYLQNQRNKTGTHRCKICGKTFSNNYQKFNGNPFKNSISGQIRYNLFYNIEKHHSIFLFSQIGKSQRSMIDRRFLLGGGIRQRITPSKNSGYIDLAYGGFYENEKYPEYNIDQTAIPSEVYNNLRLTLNIFTRLKLNDHWNLVSVMYSQWKSNRMKNYRIFFDSTLNYIISKKATIFLKFNARIQSEPYIPFVANETDTLLGFRVSI